MSVDEVGVIKVNWRAFLQTDKFELWANLIITLLISLTFLFCAYLLLTYAVEMEKIDSFARILLVHYFFGICALGVALLNCLVYCSDGYSFIYTIFN